MRHEREREREGGREKARARERINVRADDRVLKGKSKEAEAKALKSLFIDFIKGVYFFVLYTRTWHLRYMRNTNKGMQCAHQQECIAHSPTAHRSCRSPTTVPCRSQARASGSIGACKFRDGL